jgi:citrate synthase
MGFGHRIYKKGDSRVPTMRKYYLHLADWKGEKKLPEISRILEETMIRQKGIYPNLDFPTGPTYHLMGIPVDFFTPVFVASRITGWTAHVLEQLADNRLIRPKSQYVGHSRREVPPLAARG